MAEKILSIFIDESGDFGAYESHCPYYLVSMVMHDQRIEIKDNLLSFATALMKDGVDVVIDKWNLNEAN